MFEVAMLAVVDFQFKLQGSRFKLQFAALSCDVFS